MDALVFLGEVVGPVVVRVVVAGQGAEFEDRFGAGRAPAGAGDVHAVLDEVAAGAFDDAGRDRPAGVERGGVVRVGVLVGQVLGGGVRAGALGGVQAGDRGGASDAAGHAGRAALQDACGVAADPCLGGGVAFLVEGPGGLPEVLDDVHEVHDDLHRRAACAGFGLDALAVSHLSLATGPGVALARWASSAGGTSAAARGAGVAS